MLSVAITVASKLLLSVVEVQVVAVQTEVLASTSGDSGETSVELGLLDGGSSSRCGADSSIGITIGTIQEKRE